MKLKEIFQRVIQRIPIYSKQLSSSIKKNGLLLTVKRIFKKIFRFVITGGDGSKLMRISYGEWMSNIESKYLNEESMESDLRKLKAKPKFSIIFPVWNKSEEMLQSALDSITSQVYPNWEICISDGSTKNVKESREFLKKFADKYGEKVKFSTIDIDGINIIENTNNALSMATGEYVVFMDCDDEISRNCLLELAKGIENNPEVEFLYSDFDHIDKYGKRYSPSFWPGWSPHRLLSQMYTTHVTCYKKNVVDKLDGVRKGFEGAQDWDLVLRFTLMSSRNRILHISKILYHWRAYEDSTAMVGSGAKDWAYESQIKAISSYLKERGYNSIISPGGHKGIFDTHILVRGRPKVSIVIAFRDKVDFLRKCLTSILLKTKYDNYEIVLINNNSEEDATYSYLQELRDSRIKLLNYNKPFHFGKMYNWACSKLNTEYLVILNNDTEIITDNWIVDMLGFAQLSEVGYVGAKLLYPDMRVQHAGVLVGHRGTAGHIQVLSKDSDPGYLSSLFVIRNSLALTGACLMIDKDKFFSVGGFEESLDPAYQDVDLGIKLYEDGYYNVFLPFVKLFHYESISRLDPRLSKDLTTDVVNAERLKKRWPQYIYNNKGEDPFYNSNLSYHESDCRIKSK